MYRDINQKIRIWIVEDDEELLELLSRFLIHEDRIIKRFKNGKDVLNEIEKDCFDILLTDLVMPEVDGFTLINMTKKVYPEGMVIIMTGYASLYSAIQAIKSGAYDYIRKPFKLEELEIVIKNAYEKIRLLRENRHLLKKLEEMMQDIMNIKQIWEERLSTMFNLCQVISNERNNPELELILKQIYPIPLHMEFDMNEKFEKPIQILKYLIQLKKECIINEVQLDSILNIIVK